MRERAISICCVVFLIIASLAGCGNGEGLSEKPQEAIDTQEQVVETVATHRIERTLNESALESAVVVLQSGDEKAYTKAKLTPYSTYHRDGSEVSGAFDSSESTSFKVSVGYEDFEYVCVWMYLERPYATAAHIRLNCLGVEEENTYFRTVFPLDWEGWKLLVFPLNGFMKHLGHIPDITTLKSVQIQYGGYDSGQAVEEGTVAFIDSIYLANNLYEYNYGGVGIDQYEAALQRTEKLLKHEFNFDDKDYQDADTLIGLVSSIPKTTSMTKTAEMTDLYGYVYDAARLYKYSDEYRGDSDLFEAIIAALDHLELNFFSQRNKMEFEKDNWWDWEIGVPTWIVDTLVILRDELSSDQITGYLKTVDYLNKLPSRSQANKLAIGYIVMVSALLQQDYVRVADSRDMMIDCLSYVNCESGFYEDGSYIDHLYIPYNGSYGANFIHDLTKLTMMLSDTVFAYDQKEIDRNIELLNMSYVPFLFDGAISANLCGRAVTRPTTSDIRYGMEPVEAMIWIYPEVEDNDVRAAFHNCIINAYERNTAYYDRNLSECGLEILKNTVINDNVQSIELNDTQVQYYFNMDRASIRNENWAASISLSGSRIAKYEAINGDNNSGWYTGDGMTYLYTDAEDYSNEYWNNVDYYFMPGTTVTNRERVSENTKAVNFLTDRDFVGGAKQDGMMVVAMDFAGSCLEMEFQTSLTGKKSWFVFDDMILCLGTDINCSDGCEVYTVLENRIVDGKEVSTDERSINIPDYAKIVSFDQNIQYQIVHTEHDFLQATISHGVDPIDARYCYAILPLAGEIPSFEVLRNDGNVTAVECQGGKMYIFWTTGECDGLLVDSPCIVIVGDHEISVADPTQKQEEIIINLDGKEYRFSTKKRGATESVIK